ncbi:hypothetical protein [Paenibacillus aestuarii]|uniref:Uncharacterized protein n=1 Tax=Paenibacillus aestuarii TaxID=516965 RepID=A0ABW0KFQ4_9BACL|nr:hypothetical protein [Paenibacillus aestuarii]
MILLPVKFDLNEWFILITLALGYGIMFRLPPRFPKSVVILVLLLSISIVKIVDVVWMQPPYDLYDVNDTPYYELFDFFTWFLYPPFAYFCVYVYDRQQLRGLSIVLYVVASAIFSTAFEGLAVLCHVYTYKGWRFFYSFPVYITVITLTLAFFQYLKIYFKKPRT